MIIFKVTHGNSLDVKTLPEILNSSGLMVKGAYVHRQQQLSFIKIYVLVAYICTGLSVCMFVWVGANACVCMHALNALKMNCCINPRFLLIIFCIFPHPFVYNYRISLLSLTLDAIPFFISNFENISTAEHISAHCTLALLLISTMFSFTLLLVPWLQVFSLMQQNLKYVIRLSLVSVF
jgi:hypothetical protein